jgi:proline iminopeptidase
MVVVMPFETSFAGPVHNVMITTPKGSFSIWTQQFGENDSLKLLVLHGGPGGDSDFHANFPEHLVPAGVEVHLYDQLESTRSDKPNDPDLWTIERFVSEVDQVADALGLNPSNFILYGQSWGGILAMEYAFAHQDRLKGLIIANMMSSIPAYNEYARTVLMPEMNQVKLARVQELEASGETETGEFEELLMEIHYEHHILRKPFAEWPPIVVAAMGHLAKDLYVTMQGPSELGASGRLVEWDRFNDLHNINVPTLVLGGEYDSMSPRYLESMAAQMPNATSYICPNAGHMGQWDDTEEYFGAMRRFLATLPAT